MKVTVEFYISTDDGYLVSVDGYRLAYGGVPREWVVKPEDFDHLLEDEE